jgi:Reverse transcriptase (RNA-dependent DNA polymerase)
LEARSQTVPLARPNRYSLVLTPEIKLLISRKNTLRRIAQRTRDQDDKRAYKIHNKLVRETCNELQNKNFSDKIQSLRPGHKSLWSFTKLIKNKTRNIPALKIDGKYLLTGKEKADAIALQFSIAHKNSMNSQLEETVHEGCGVLRSYETNTNPSTLTSPREIKNIIKKLKNGKAPGFDGIPNILLKNLPRKALVYLTYIFNSCIKLSYFPSIWRHALVVPIPKPGKDHSAPSSYRPISLLSSISKIFEKVILKRLTNFIMSNSILPNHQFGFRKAHSTAHQLRRVVKNIKDARNSRFRRVPCSTGMLLLDVEKAFDSVWHEALLYKLIMKGCDLYLARLILSFLKNRTFQVRVDGVDSILCGIPYGVPQGAILSPTLYNIFTSDIPTSEFCKTATFADDTALYASDLNPDLVCDALQDQIDNVSNYFKDWKIKVNAEKTQAIYFSRCTKNLPTSKLKINDIEVPWTPTVKYLGVYLDKRLTFACHISESLNKAEKAFRVLYSFLNRRSKLCIQNKLLLYKACIRPILTYGVETWHDCAATHRRKLQIIQNKCLKIINNRHWRYSTSALHDESGVPLIQDFGNRIIERFLLRSRSSDNPLITDIFDT